MAKHAHPNFLDNGLVYLANSDAVLLLKSYSAGDDYATVTNAANVVASAALVPGDFTLGNGAASARQIVAAIAGMNGGNAFVSTQNGVDDLHIAFVDTVGTEVIFVTDESTDLTITQGQPVTFTNDVTYTSNQPQ